MGVTFYDSESRVRRLKKTAIAEDLGVVEFARTRLGFEADPMQARVLASEAKRGILNCTRQWGKSTVAAIKAVHRGYTVPESLVVVASPSERQSAEFVRKAARLMGETRDSGSGGWAEFGESRIVGLPGTESTIRGFSAVSLLVIDEAARVPDDLEPLRGHLG
jgi:hypothetical protein